MNFFKAWLWAVTGTVVLIGLASVILAVASFILDAAPTFVFVVFFIALTLVTARLVREGSVL